MLIVVVFLLCLVHLCNIKCLVPSAVQNLQIAEASVEHELDLLEHDSLQPQIDIVLLEREVDDKHVGPVDVTRACLWRELNLLEDLLLELQDLIYALSAHKAHAYADNLQFVVFLLLFGRRAVICRLVF